MTSAVLDDRYGRTRATGRRRWLIVAIVVGAIAVGVLGWMTVRNSIYSVAVDSLGFTASDPHSATVSFQISGRPGTPITCAMSAQDEDFGVVGYRVIDYPASDATAQRITETIRTVALATTANVDGCWVSGE